VVLPVPGERCCATASTDRGDCRRSGPLRFLEDLRAVASGRLVDSARPGAHRNRTEGAPATGEDQATDRTDRGAAHHQAAHGRAEDRCRNRTRSAQG